MGILRDRMNELDVTVDAAEAAFARLRGHDEVTMWFAPGYYSYADEARAGDRVARLGELLWASRNDAYWRALSDALGRPYRGENPTSSRRELAFRAARAEIVCQSESLGGQMRISTAGLQNWTVMVETGALSHDEQTFTQAAGQAMSTIFTRYHADVRRLAVAARRDEL